MNSRNSNFQDSQPSHWRTPVRQWLMFSIVCLLVIAIYRDALSYTVSEWLKKEEYSHGILIPFIALFLIWQKKNELSALQAKGSWMGLPLILLGLLIFFVGELSTLFILEQYSFLLAVFGLTLAFFGKFVFRKLFLPLFLLFFAIPLPNFLYQGLSAKLQLWSTALGVTLIRACNISVYQEGNVIDLGAMQLQVVEACSGLRYLFPLMSLAFICAYFYQAAFWKRLVVFLSSMPITILMNSFRIGAIGVLVEYWGKSMAEGFLHDFEGWIIFMVCTAILVGEMWLLARIGGDPRPLAELFGLTMPEPLPAETRFRDREPSPQIRVSLAMVLTALGLSLTLDHRAEIVPERAQFAQFPLSLGNWKGRRKTLEQQYIDILKFEDYILADYHKDGDVAPVNFYSAYYASQRKGESIHSPRSCIPGGGWQITSMETFAPKGVSIGRSPMKINRLTIQKGDDRQLVYYWFQQRGRNITNEYAAKWYLLWDALTRNRTDGALVRLTTFAPKGEDPTDSDRRLTEFLKLAEAELGAFVPQ